MKLTTKIPDATWVTKRTCSRCNRTGHLATTCTSALGRIDMIGVEVEGWWRDRYATDRLATGIRAVGKSDGSLENDDTGETTPREYCTRPGSLGAVAKAVHTLYPDKYDASAGMHIHVSVKDPADISLLMSTGFRDYALARWRLWGTEKEVRPGSQFWRRLEGENRYCAALGAEDLAAGTNHSRYRWLNFASWGAHRTFELRVLPLFGKESLAISALEEWVSIVEDYLASRTAWQPEPVEVAVAALDLEVTTMAFEVPVDHPDGAEMEDAVHGYEVPEMAPGDVLLHAGFAAQRFELIIDSARF